MNKTILLLVGAILAFFGMLSCEDPTSVGESVLPDNDLLATDSITFTDFKLNTIADDTLYTGFRNSVLIGQRNNLTFGHSDAQFFTDFHYDGNFEAITNPTIDSAKIYLNITGFEGDTSSIQNIGVYLMNESLEDRNILVSKQFEYGEKIATFTDVRYSPSALAENAYFITPIDQEFALELLTKLNDGSISDNDELQAEYKGLAFVPEFKESANSVVTANVSGNSNSGFEINYKGADGEAKVKRFSFAPIISEENYSVYNHNYLKTDYENGNSEIASQISAINPVGNSSAYIQGSNGVLALLEFDSVMDGVTSSDVINNAAITIKPQVEPTDSTLLPSQLTLYEEFIIDDEGKKTGALVDIVGNGLSAKNPNRRYDLVATATLLNVDDVFSYTFFLPNYLQESHAGVNGVAPKLYIGVPNRSATFRGIKFAKEDVTMKVFYSKTN